MPTGCFRFIHPVKHLAHCSICDSGDCQTSRHSENLLTKTSVVSTGLGYTRDSGFPSMKMVFDAFLWANSSKTKFNVQLNVFLFSTHRGPKILNHIGKLSLV
jgi:hypothetical protein